MGLRCSRSSKGSIQGDFVWHCLVSLDAHGLLNSYCQDSKDLMNMFMDSDLDLCILFVVHGDDFDLEETVEH